MRNWFSGGLFKTRRGALIVSVVAAVLAAILLVVYLQSYKRSVDSGSRSERVLVATHFIARGTSATTIAIKGLYETTTVQKNELEPSAIFDASSLAGRIAATDIYPGQQLTQPDFTTEGAGSIPYEITGAQRAIAVPVDSTHGLIGQVAAGDYVDIYIDIADGGGGNNDDGGGTVSSNAATQVRLLMPDILVLAVPGDGGSNMVLRVNSTDAAEFAYAADYERLWFVLRPQVDATKTPSEIATLASLLAGKG